jgi:hypothetical protein
MGIKEDFQAIFDAWNKGGSYSDIYHMIVAWLETYEFTLDETIEAVRIFVRIDKGREELKDIVADFIYGECCATLRTEFGRT